MELTEILFFYREQMVWLGQKVTDPLGIRLAGPKVRIQDKPALFMKRDERIEFALHAVEVIDKRNRLEDVTPCAVPVLQIGAEWTEAFPGTFPCIPESGYRCT